MHPTNKKVLMFRRIAKRNEKSELLSDGGQLRWNWQFPQGGIDPGESEEETLFRELEEEIGTNDVTIIRVAEKESVTTILSKCCIFFINNLNGDLTAANSNAGFFYS